MLFEQAAEHNEGIIENLLNQVDNLQTQINEIKNYRDVFNSYVIRTKYQFELFKHLRNKKIEALINWPYPLYKHKGLGFKGIYLDKTEKACKEIISLPIFPEIKMSEIMYITKTIKKFFVKN